jgi:hypothetical protein
MNVLCGGESGHVRTSLGDHDVSGESTDAGDGADHVPEKAKGFHHHLDPLVRFKSPHLPAERASRQSSRQVTFCEVFPGSVGPRPTVGVEEGCFDG